MLNYLTINQVTWGVRFVEAAEAVAFVEKLAAVGGGDLGVRVSEVRI